MKNSSIWFFLRKLRDYWHLALVVFLTDGLITILGMVPPILMVLVFDYAYPQKDLAVFTAVTLVSFGIYFLDFIFSAHIDFINIYIFQKLDYDISLNLFKKIQNLPILALNRLKIGDLTVRLTSDVGSIVTLITHTFTDLIMNLIKLSIFLYITLKFDYKITLLSLLSIPLYAIETKFYSKKEQGLRLEMQQADSDVYDGIQTKLLNVRTTKAFNQQAHEEKDLGVRLRKTFILSIKESIVSITAVFTNSLTIRLWAVFVAWYLGYEVINGKLTIGEVVALGIYLPLLEQPISGLAGIYKRLRVSSVSTRRVAEILTAKEEDPLSENKPDIKITRGDIEFKNVTFKFQGDIPAVKNFSLHIPQRSSVALVGESGSGKSTILNLLLRFYDCQEGEVTIDDQNIRDINVMSLREKLGVVFQETTIVDGTVRENIIYGAKGKTEVEIIKAAEDAGMHEFIKGLPEGYGTNISSHAHGLSVGQRQRLAIARVLLRDPEILILDEPTSALDAASEYLISETIHRALGSRTVIIVAHRLSTVRRIQKIVVMSKGEIVEEGSFDELMKKKGHFFKLYNMQFGGFQKFAEEFDIELQRVMRYGQDLTLVMGEVKEFDQLINEHHPKLASKYMEEVNLFISKKIRVMDFSSVYLDNRLVIAMPETGSKGAKVVLDRIINTLKDIKLEVDDVKIGVTMRAGLVSCHDIHAKYGEDMFEKASDVLARMPSELDVGTFADTEETIW